MTADDGRKFAGFGGAFCTLAAFAQAPSTTPNKNKSVRARSFA